jgi:hypothetical protein
MGPHDEMDTNQVADPSIREFIEVAYLRTHRHFSQKQREQNIWEAVMKHISVGDLRREMVKFGTGKAPGASGVTIEMIKLMSDENLERLATTMNSIVLGGGQVPASWNMTLLRPLPKTEAGLYDISKTRPIALMEVALKLLERVIFSRINTVVDDNNMLRGGQYGGINGRQIQDPIRILAELIEDANVTKKELHIFSADLSKAFDTLEYWSQAMSWRALGAPKSMVNMLVDMDKGGQTAVILAPGRTTETVLGQEGLYANARGVRQGSIGGPMKWVVFMNFWLEYVHSTSKGKGYRMNDNAPEIIGQMFIDDSNWMTTNSEDMTATFVDCNAFVSFHGLKFNKSKCEYMAINQPDSRQEGDSYSEWSRPRWPSGERITPKARQVENMREWTTEHKDIVSQIACHEGDCIDMGLHTGGESVPTE